VEEYGGAREAKDDSIIGCMLDNKDLKHTEYYVMLIAFPWQQWLQEYTSLLHYMYIDPCFVTGLSIAEQVASLVTVEQ